MTTLDRVRQVIAATLKLPLDRVSAEASMETLTEWDSLAQVNLMMSIEQEFGLFLEVEDFAKLISVPAIVAFLEAPPAR